MCFTFDDDLLWFPVFLGLKLPKLPNRHALPAGNPREENFTGGPSGRGWGGRHAGLKPCPLCGRAFSPAYHGVFQHRNI